MMNRRVIGMAKLKYFVYRNGVKVPDVLSDGTDFWEKVKDKTGLEDRQYDGYQADGTAHDGNLKKLKFETEFAAAEWTKRWESAPVRWFASVWDVEGPFVHKAEERILDGVMYKWNGEVISSEEVSSYETQDEAIEVYLASIKKAMVESKKLMGVFEY